jgi:nucleoside-diphosphate-sugar epimerase
LHTYAASCVFSFDVYKLSAVSFKTHSVSITRNNSYKIKLKPLLKTFLNMAGELALLTGATGFVGFATLRQALKHGYKVRAAVRSEKKAETVRSNPTLKDISEDQLSFVVIPDFLADGAFDESIKDVDYILHIASPIPRPELTGNEDLKAEFITPAIQATESVIKSAHKVGKNVKRIVITSSAAAIVPVSAFAGSDEVWTPEHRTDPIPEPYFNNVQVAYGTSKTLALKAAEDFVAAEKPDFDIIHIHPVLVVGRDELALTSKDVASGSNQYAIAGPLGISNAEGFPVVVTHIDDVALAHIRALDPKVAGNQSFLLSSTGSEGYTVSLSPTLHTTPPRK